MRTGIIKMPSRCSKAQKNTLEPIVCIQNNNSLHLTNLFITHTHINVCALFYRNSLLHLER